MKKILSLLVLLVAFASCEEDVKFNNPAVQGLKDNELWRASSFEATKAGNTIIITARTDFEVVTLRINAAAPESVHNLGLDDVNTAAYDVNVDGVAASYKTGTDLGNGRITIRRAEDNNINATDGRGYISGNFYFNAVDGEGNVVNYQEGVFYKVPITVQL